MYCPNCGKQIKAKDNFCRYCGVDLRTEETSSESLPEYKLPVDSSEELVIYDVKKHIMALFWPIFMTPVFFIYFWTIFLNTHSFFSWVIIFIILIPIVYPILRFNSDKIIITTKFVHVKIGVLNPEEIDIPLAGLNILELYQTSMGRIMDYGTVSFMSNGQQLYYGYIKEPAELQYIIENPAKYIHESLEEEKENFV